MNNWLENFAYRTDISWMVFVSSGFIAILVALLTVSYPVREGGDFKPCEVVESRMIR